jgi:hypothetical protein
MNTQALKEDPASRAIACTVAGCLSLFCFTWLLHRFVFRKSEPIHIGSDFHIGPSPAQLLTWAGVALAGVALGFCLWSWRKDSRWVALAATLVALHAIVVWGLLLLALC